MRLTVDEQGESCAFHVRVAPDGGSDEVLGKHGDAVRVRVTEPAIEGRASEALCEFLAHQLGVSRQDVEVLSGRTSRWKRVRVRCVSAADVRRWLERSI